MSAKSLIVSLAGLPMLLWAAMTRFERDNGWILSSHVAMSLMLAIFPFALFVVSLASALSSDLNTEQLVGVVLSLWPEAIAAPIAEELRAVLSADSVRLMTLGGVLALYFASNGVDAVRLAITRAYRDEDPRPFWKTRALCVMFVLVVGAVTIASLTIGLGLPAYFHFIAEAIPDPYGPWIESRVLTTSVTVGLLVLIVGSCHVWLPGMRHKFAEVWPGVVLTILLWFAAVKGFALYLAHFANYSATYAGLAGAMAALIFLYLMAAILIIGAEFNGTLIRRRKSGD